jgi:hypothetical protein
MVLPLLLVLLFGIIDAGRWMWMYNEAEKATQMGARFAIVSNPVSPGIRASYLAVNGLMQGDPIAAGEFGKITCTVADGCVCTTTPCPSPGTFDSPAFEKIGDRMRLFLPQLSNENIAIEYSSSGLGYAGNPDGPDISPMVTVKVGSPATPLQFTPITSFLLTSMNMPSFTTSLTAEDLSGAQSN